MAADVVLAVVGGALVALSLLSTVARRLWLSPVLLALLVGVAVGPHGTGWLDPLALEHDRRALEELARITLALSLMAIGLQVNSRDLRETIRPAGALLAGGMVGMWALTGLGAWLLLDVPFWAGFLLGAILTPTDPVVASTIVTGRMAEANVTRRVRRTLSLESGANDGLALPFVLLAVFMLTHEGGVGAWALEAAKELGIAVGVGGAVGYGVGRVAELGIEEREVEVTELLGLGIALALFVLGAVHLLGGSGILAAFVAALAFSHVLERHVREELERVQEAVSRFVVLPVFLFFGAALPWSAWGELGVAGLVFALWVLLVRRPPVVPLVLARAGVDRRGVAFLAWFGPIGVAALYYAAFIHRHAVPHEATIFAAATLAIAASVVVHSVTATPGVRLHAGRSPFTPLRHPLRPRVEEEP